jgi:DNA modification methylase
MTVRVEHGDSREVLKTLADASVDACVTDPPYSLISIQKRIGKPGSAPAQEGRDGLYRRASAGFMGKTWDTGETAFDPAFWAEVYRVMKPGAHLVAFSGTRTYHRMTCAIEDAGFEIRDQIGWLYGSGFPKSHDVSKGIQKRRTEDAEPVRSICRSIRAAMDAKDLKSRHLVEHFDGCHPRLIDHWAARDTDSQPGLPTWEQWLRLKEVLAIGAELDAEVWRLNGRKGTPGAAWSDAEIIGEVEGVAPGLVGMRFAGDNTIRVASDDAAAWEGWGTALKPAWEPICLARKPLIGTVAANVLAHGTGALNIDGCRVGLTDGDDPRLGGNGSWTTTQGQSGDTVSLPRGTVGSSPLGRWPANVIHDGSEEVLAAFPDAPGQQRDVTGAQQSHVTKNAYGDFTGEGGGAIARGDSGSAARFFYSAKADSEDRLGSKHPTVKPIDLIAYLCRLITPPGGTVLDCFAGSGTTGAACLREGFDCILIEREAEYIPDIMARIELASADGRHPQAIKHRNVNPAKARGEDLPLFGPGPDESEAA